jgi:hypothetical protein
MSGLKLNRFLRHAKLVTTAGRFKEKVGIIENHYWSLPQNR